MPDWFNSKKVEDFAKDLAKDLVSRYPPSAQADPKKASPGSLAAALEDVYSRAIKFKQDNKLGIYKKAKLGNVFKWELKERGYDESFVDEVTKGLVIRLAQK